MNYKKTDILIIGMGLAGITAAITAAEKGKKVTILTKANHFLLEALHGHKEELYIKGLMIVQKN